MLEVGITSAPSISAVVLGRVLLVTVIMLLGIVRPFRGGW